MDAELLKQIDITKKFPTLYKKNANGKIKQWSIIVSELDDKTAKYVMSTGFIGGKQTERTRMVIKGKNIGRKNETTPYEQAMKDALSKFRTKMKTFKPDLLNVKEGDIEPYPMLLQKYNINTNAKKGKIKYPCYIQRKYDGNRGFVTFVNNDIVMYSRGREKIVSMEHIRNEFKQLFKDWFNNSEKIYIDGEFYSHGQFHQITSGIVNETKNITSLTTNKDKESIRFHIFDVYFIQNPNMIYSERLKVIEDNFSKFKYKYITKVPTTIVKSEKEMMEMTKKFKKDGYEGSILRNMNGKYKAATGPNTGGRSSDVQKYKIIQEDDAKIIGIIKVPDHDNFGIKFNLISDHNKEFTVNGNSNEEIREATYKAKDTIINTKKLVFTYQDTTKDGLPRGAVPVLLENGMFKLKELY